MHYDWATKALRLCERLFERRDVVAVDRADVLQAQVFEKSLWRQHIFESALDAVQRIEEWFTDQRCAPENFLDLLQRLLIPRVRAQCREMFGQTTDGL